jgi:hypothetical protein
MTVPWQGSVRIAIVPVWDDEVDPQPKATSGSRSQLAFSTILRAATAATIPSRTTSGQSRTARLLSQAPCSLSRAHRAAM